MGNRVSADIGRSQRIIESAKLIVAEWDAEKAKRLNLGYGAIWTPREVEFAQVLIQTAEELALTVRSNTSTIEIEELKKS